MQSSSHQWHIIHEAFHLTPQHLNKSAYHVSPSAREEKTKGSDHCRAGAQRGRVLPAAGGSAAAEEGCRHIVYSNHEQRPGAGIADLQPAADRTVSPPRQFSRAPCAPRRAVQQQRQAAQRGHRFCFACARRANTSRCTAGARGLGDPCVRGGGKDRSSVPSSRDEQAHAHARCRACRRHPGRAAARRRPCSTA